MGRQSAGDTLVVHLIWAPLGPEVLTRFMQSYSQHEAGVEHRLLFLFNGFATEHDLTPWRLAIEHLNHQELRLVNPVLDLAAYRQAVEATPASRYCFLNSYSVIRTDGWLALMNAIADRPGVGAVGASGSWASRFSGTRWALGLGGPYGPVFPDRAATGRAIASVSAHNDAPPPTSVERFGRVYTLMSKLSDARKLVAHAAAYASFPSPHLRTNCFLIDRDVWLRACRRAPSNKEAAYGFESGRRGMTPRIRRMGLRVLVAGCDGRGYEIAEWPASRTFWQGDQENLLVEDNQTRDYQNGEMMVRRALSGYAWGLQADPVEARPVEGA